MVKIITTFAILISSVTFAQTQTVQVYGYTNGVRNVLPQQTIIKTESGTNVQKTEIYNNTNGIKNITPETIIKPNGDIHKVENGFPQILPIGNIQVEDGNNKPAPPIVVRGIAINPAD